MFTTAVARPPLSTRGMTMLVWMQCSHESPLLIMRPLMVTLAGLEPATSPAPENKDALSPLSYSAVTIFMTVCGGARA